LGQEGREERVEQAGQEEQEQVMVRRLGGENLATVLATTLLEMGPKREGRGGCNVAISMAKVRAWTAG